MPFGKNGRPRPLTSEERLEIARNFVLDPHKHQVVSRVAKDRPGEPIKFPEREPLDITKFIKFRKPR